MARKFMYVCLGILALVVAYHLGAAEAKSSLQSDFVSVSGGGSTDHDLYVLASNGDLHMYNMDDQNWYSLENPTGGAINQITTWGRVKAEFGE